MELCSIWLSHLFTFLFQKNLSKINDDRADNGRSF